jgi:hypothetical protein
MGKHFFVNGDRTVDSNDRLWVTSSNIFHAIFDRVEKNFRPHEQTCREKCFEDTGIDGIDLDFISKDCFNIFYLHCEEALEHYPDVEMLVWLDKFSDEPEKRDDYVNGITWYWSQEVLKRLTLDKRYDPAWIEGYRHSRARATE